MKLAVIAFTQNGGRLGARVAEAFSRTDVVEGYLFDKYAKGSSFTPFHSLSELLSGLFSRVDGLIFIGACGIAVRGIAPLLKGKAFDPAVTVMDEKGEYAISLLSGHIGGANRLALEIEARVGAKAVITTATDVRNRFAVDVWAVENSLSFTDFAAAKEISACILAGEPVGFSSDYPVDGALPFPSAPDARTGIFVSAGRGEALPFERTLVLTPKRFILGIGCKKGTSREAIEALALCVLRPMGLDFSDIRSAASIDLKKEEPGLLEFARSHRLLLRFFTAGELQAVPGDFSASAFVRQTTGVDNVCERSALLAGGDRLVVRKTPLNGVTIALARLDDERITLRF